MSITRTDAAEFLADHAIEGMKDNSIVNDVTFAETGWTGDLALEVYTTEARGEVAEAAAVGGAVEDAADIVQAWLDRGTGFKIDVQRALDDAHHCQGCRRAIVEHVDSIGGHAETHLIAWVRIAPGEDCGFGIDWSAERGTFVVVAERNLEVTRDNEFRGIGTAVLHLLNAETHSRLMETSEF